MGSTKNSKGMASSRSLPSSLAPGDAAAIAKVDNGKVAKNKTKRAMSKKFIAEDDDTDSDGETEIPSKVGGKTTFGGKSMKSYTGPRSSTGGKSYTGGGKQTIKQEKSDTEYEVEESDDDQGATGIKQPLVHGRRKKQKYDVDHDKTPNPNGRVPGRKLIMWHRPRMVEKMMLHLQYECHRNGISIPWDKIVERMSTGSSGAAALQHLNKLRDILITEGHMVPPLMGKKSVKQDLTIRGFIRDMDSDKPTETRVVRWGEEIEDRKENLEIDGVIRGSGNYRRGTYKILENTQKASGERRNRLPVELRETQAGFDDDADAKPATNNKKRSARSARIVSERLDSPDPAQLASDEEYDPSLTKKVKLGGRTLRKASKPGRYKVESSDDEADEQLDQLMEDTMPSADTLETPKSKRSIGEGLMTPPGTKRSDGKITFNVSPRFLRKLDRGERIAPKEYRKLQDDLDHDLEQHGDDMEEGFENSGDGAEDQHEWEAGGDYDSPTRQPRVPRLEDLTQEILRSRGYGKPISEVEAPKFNLPQLPHRTYAASSYQNHGLPLISALAGSSAGTFSNNHASAFLGNHIGNHSLSAPTGNDQGFGNMMGGGGSRSGSIGQGGGADFTDPFFDGFDSYNSAGTLMDGNTSFSANGFPALTFDHDFSMGFGDADFTSANTQASSSFASGLPISEDNSVADTFPANDHLVQDDANSVAMSSPGHYALYLHDDNKAKQEDYSDIF